MRLNLILIYFLFFPTVMLAIGNEPEGKSYTDAMLFGDVKSGGEHIPFATVSIKGTTIGTAADATGHFKITDLPAGRQTVVITAVGYKPFSRELEFTTNRSVTLRAELLPDNIGIEQIVISADRNVVSRKPCSVWLLPEPGSLRCQW